MPSLPDELFGPLERAVLEARETAERAADAALNTLAVNRAEPYASMNPEQRRLRNGLRARARQLGDGSLHHGLPLLAEEIAYQQWHRMLFARFLAENELLMHPSGVPVTLQDCAELAPEEGEADAWSVAARYASATLPGIFRSDDPAVQVRFAPEGRLALERILAELPKPVFASDDGLGWMYQFWQSKKKDEVNASERKIGGADIAPVTQLFTEDYMVRFLLENSLGAWWAARHPDSPLVKTFTYLRLREDGVPAAGAFPGWPDHAAWVTLMDPCCGSGHFLIVAFLMLYLMRMEEEGLDATAAGDAVLRDNLYGLELDPRCTQIAAFALALTAWKTGGYRLLPVPNVACSGIPVRGQLETWTRLAGDDEALWTALARLYDLFQNAPDLGSLIDPIHVPPEQRMFTADFEQVEPLLEEALAREQRGDGSAEQVFGSAARGILSAARLLSREYTLVVTNVPYLTRRKQGDVLRDFSEKRYPTAKDELATCFLVRCLGFCQPKGVSALVTTQNWQFLTSYEDLRVDLLTTKTWLSVIRLGPRAFRSIGGEVVNVALFMFHADRPPEDNMFAGLDVTEAQTPGEKARWIQQMCLGSVSQSMQLGNPDKRITLKPMATDVLLDQYASCYAGILNGDSPRFQRLFWEIVDRKDMWVFQQSTVLDTRYYGGREKLIFFDGAEGHLRASSEYRREKLHDSDQRGNRAWGKRGVAISQMGSFPVSLYDGDKFDSNIAVMVPDDQLLLPAMWAFCSSPGFYEAVRRIDQKLNVTNATFAKVSFNLEHWQGVADAAGPLPEPDSDDPNQWLFGGRPVDSIDPLQVAVARLLGYRWPQQEKDDLDAYTVDDGILCLPPVAGEPPGAERLRVLLAAAYGQNWSSIRQEQLLAAVDFTGGDLEAWLRDGFFARHCKMFQNRPFIWHIWDGRKDGFSALVNYHKLGAAHLDKLIYTYLGDWIQTQRQKRDAGEAGADGRLVLALELQKKLIAIREGEPPHDIYIRWKPLHEQPIGWNPDLNDGMRLNIRPFVVAGVLRRRFTIDWKKDRGRNPDGSERINDRHYMRADKLAARAET